MNHRPVRVLAATAAAIGFSVLMGAPAGAAPSTVKFCGTPSDQSFVDVPPTAESVGDMRSLKYTLLDASGKKRIGTGIQLSTLVSSSGSQQAMARVRFTLPKGVLIVDATPTFESGFLNPAATPVNSKDYGIIVGGSGIYGGAHGTMSLQMVDRDKRIGCWTATLG